ncbi:hypothetical protein COMNV_00966 [Commensalibacter sp. Nvir]|uniref:type II toxin-antitoxin system HicB family antitoxin n=1 Tax=Commensalibacter sp. Nvir TaxID=3069817 RepID=UPI002D233F2D|nr:hypothetical protein COMNV_00966 [Commensalibacter sp. Nvir]
MSILHYKNYTGVFDYDPEADIFHGEVINISDVITFQGRSIDELKQALTDSVEDYLDFCKTKGKNPDKPFSGRFNLRIHPSLHERIVVKAKQKNKSLNAWIAETLEKAV